jgi:hypothetical protein
MPVITPLRRLSRWKKDQGQPELHTETLSQKKRKTVKEKNNSSMH